MLLSGEKMLQAGEIANAKLDEIIEGTLWLEGELVMGRMVRMMVNRD